jgi:hypothetical protein
MHRSLGSGRAFQGKHARHRRSTPIGWRTFVILFIIQQLATFFESSFRVGESPSKASQWLFLFGFTPRLRDPKLAMMCSIFVASYAFAILLSMIGIAGPPMVLRRREAHSDQHGLLLR